MDKQEQLVVPSTLGGEGQDEGKPHLQSPLLPSLPAREWRKRRHCTPTSWHVFSIARRAFNDDGAMLGTVLLVLALLLAVYTLFSS